MVLLLLTGPATLAAAAALLLPQAAARALELAHVIARGKGGAQGQQRVREGPPAMHLRLGQAGACHSSPCQRGANASPLTPSSAHLCPHSSSGSAGELAAHSMQCASPLCMRLRCSHPGALAPPCCGCGRMAVRQRRLAAQAEISVAAAAPPSRIHWRRTENQWREHSMLSRMVLCSWLMDGWLGRTSEAARA